jgi:hypothetical protein
MSEPSKDYILDLVRRSKSANRAVAFRATAELEDINDGHWDGQRYDDPPENWYHAGANSIPSIRHPHGIADTESGEPIILVLHRAKKQKKGPLTRYESESGAFKFSVDWSYVDINLRDDPEHIELLVTDVTERKP